MSVVQNNLLLASDTGGYTIARSVRLRQSASAYLNRTPASASNRKTWTWSSWVKLGKPATTGLFTAATSSANMFTIQLGSDGSFSVYAYASSAYQYFRVTSAVFRDYSAWYHFVVAFDTTQATDTNRIKIYVNGVLQSTTSGSGTGWPTLNYDGGVNSAINHQFSDTTGGASYYDGYLTEINFIDGQALTPSSFGSTNTTTGVWQPIKYTGTYGTNGFYLNFSDNSSNTATTIGKDYSGNGNNWTPNNISVTAGVTYDSMVDSPTVGATSSNYAVLNPLDVANTGTRTIQAGNLDINTSSGSGGARSTFQLPTTGKWYFEGQYVSGTWSGNKGFGIGTSTSDISGNVIPTGCVTYNVNGYKTTSGAYSAYGSSYTTTDTVGIAVDQDAGTVTFYKNSTSQGAITHGLSVSNLFPLFVDPSSVASVQSLNFGQRPFSYTPPTGYVALNTYNLPASTITNGAAYMNAILNSGNGTSRTDVVAFQPDFVWTKTRNTATNGFNIVQDSVRGAGYRLITDGTYAETFDSTYGSFTSTGFTFGSNLNINTNGNSYVDWMWKAGTTSSSNTNGSITSTVSAGATQGFSVVTYTAPASGAYTVGHSLGVAPKFIITKPRGINGDWVCYHESLGNNAYIVLNTTAGQVTGASTVWNNTSPTSTVFSLGSGYAGYGTMVAYCFAPVAGYSAFGSYTGNGSADGPFIYTGFRPRLMMWKRTDATADWYMWDTTRNTYNGGGKVLWPNYSSAETDYGTGSSGLWDILSNGFKLRTNSVGMNTNGATMIYMAFAENPFKNALAR